MEIKCTLHNTIKDFLSLELQPSIFHTVYALFVIRSTNRLTLDGRELYLKLTTMLEMVSLP